MSLSDEDAKKEVEEINAEIAKEKGIKPEDEPEENKSEDEEDKEPDEPKDAHKEAKEEDEDADDDEEDKTRDEKGKVRSVPVSKYQALKKTSREKAAADSELIADKDKQIAELNEKLAKTQTTDEMKTKVKAYADKHGKTEEEVMELLDILPKATLAPETVQAEKRIQIEAKKAEAEEAYRTEYQELASEIPEVKDHADALRKAAFKDKNLGKSLFEIFHREIKPTLTVKKTAETSRASRRDTAGEPDYAKIMEDVKNNKTDAMNGLSDKQLDELFDRMDKSGSRYTRSR